MPDDRYIVLLNDALKGRLLALGGRARARMREKFEFLENGFWDAGVRVKKLRGTAGRVIFEARMDRGDRLLFTLGPHRGRTAIYVWGLVSHDDISTAASRIVPGNAPFLDFAPLEEEERADLTLEGLPPGWRNQEDVEERVPEDYGPQKWLVLDEAEWRRLLAQPDPAGLECYLLLTREQEELLSAQPPILLSGTAGSGKTTLSLYYLLRGATPGSRRLFLTYNPLLKESAQRAWEGLARNRDPAALPPTPRFAVFRDLLREMVAEADADFPPEREVGLVEFTRIFADHRDRRKHDPELVWEEIRSIIKGARLPLNPVRLESLGARFLSRQASPAERAELREQLLAIQDLPLAARAGSSIEERTSLAGWAGLLRGLDAGVPGREGDLARGLEVVTRLVQKASGDWSSPLLSLEEYLALGKKRAPLFPYDRREIHAIAEFYQERLARSGRWDEIDLSRAALRRMDGRAEEFSWDLVVCDEVQDLTDVQLSLLFRLASNPRLVILTGDPRQIVNPSGFRWEEVKNKFFERGIPAPAVRRLSLNFRSAGSLVQLSNALLDIKADLVGLTDTEMREQWKFAGRPPLVLEGLAEEAILRSIDLRGAGQAVLVRTPAERDRLKAALATERVFTITEAKGLEFDAVFLWRFCGDAQAEELWSSIAAGQRPDLPRTPHLRHEIALLYVAVTRARNTLVAWDGEKASAVWESAGVAPLVFRSSEPESFSERWHSVSSPAEWDAQGEYYLARGQYAAARECFRNAGNDARLALAGAHVLARNGDDAGAAALFETAGEQRQAAECRERAADWAGARRLWRLLGEAERERVCAARMHEAAGSFSKAAREWEAAGESRRALECWERAGAWERAARASLKIGEFLRAAPLFEKARLPREAAECLEKAGRAEAAADLYVRAGELVHAARLYEAAGAEEKLLACLRSIGDDLAEGGRLEARGDARGARAAYARMAARSPADRERLLASVPGAQDNASARTAGLRLSALAVPIRAGRLLLRAGELVLAAEDFERAGLFDDVALCREQLGQFRDAARALEGSGVMDRGLARRLHGLLHAYLTREAADAAKAAEELYTEALTMEAEGKLVPALVRFRLLQDRDKTLELSTGLNWHEEALAFLLEMHAPADALAYARKHEVSFAAGDVGRMIEDHWTGARPSGEPDEPDSADMAGLFAELLLRVPGSAADAEMADVLEAFLRTAFSRGLEPDCLPEPLLALIIRRGAAGAAAQVLHAGLTRGRVPTAGVRAFAAEVARAARRTGDPAMTEAAAWAAGRLPT